MFQAPQFLAPALTAVTQRERIQLSYFDQTGHNVGSK